MKNEDALMMMMTRYRLLAKSWIPFAQMVLSKNISSMFMHSPCSEQFLDFGEHEQELMG